MKKLFIAITMALTINANATGLAPQPTAHASAAASAFGVGVGIGQGGAGGQSGSVTSTINQNSDYGDLKIVPSAIAPSVSMNVICPMVQQGSKAGSVFFASVSGTTSAEIVPICVAWQLKQLDVVEKMTCAASKEYALANVNCTK